MACAFAAALLLLLCAAVTAPRMQGFEEQAAAPLTRLLFVREGHPRYAEAINLPQPTMLHAPTTAATVRAPDAPTQPAHSPTQLLRGPPTAAAVATTACQDEKREEAQTAFPCYDLMCNEQKKRWRPNRNRFREGRACVVP